MNRQAGKKTHGWTDRQRQTDRQIDRQTDRQTGSQTDGQSDRQTDRQTDGQTGRQAGRQTDRQTDKHKKRVGTCSAKIFVKFHSTTFQPTAFLRSSGSQVYT